MRFKPKSKTLKNICLSILLAFVFLGLLAPFLANEKSILIIEQDHDFHFFPTSINDSIVFEIQAAIPHSPQNVDVKNLGAKGPFDEQNYPSAYYRHWLGTDLIGRDVLSAIIHGSQTSLLIGFASIFISGILGILIGGFAGYFGDNGLKISRLRAFTLAILSIFLLLYFVQIQKFNWVTKDQITEFIFLLIFQAFLLLGIVSLINFLLKKLEAKFRWKSIPIPIDHTLSRVIEIVSTLPILFIIITLSAILKPSIWNVVLIIGLTGWTGIARFTRSEFLSLKAQNFVLSAKSLGLPNRKILFKHILPNAYTTLFTAITFALAGVILAETTLSFLGVGLPPEQVSWGSILAMARQQPEAWWLAFFPSLSIFLVIFSLHYLAGYYNRFSQEK